MTLDELLAESLRLRAQLEEMMRTPAPATQAPTSGFDSEALLRKPTGDLTTAEREHLRGEVNSVLRDMGR
jgi:hypothetical protein